MTSCFNHYMWAGKVFSGFVSQYVTKVYTGLMSCAVALLQYYDKAERVVFLTTTGTTIPT